VPGTLSVFCWTEALLLVAIALYRVLGWGLVVSANLVGLPQSGLPQPTITDAIFPGGPHRHGLAAILSVMPDFHDFPKHDSTANRGG